jgi:hypothetical protein
MSVTCPICKTSIELKPDRILKFCHCGTLGVDCDKNYTRYLGIDPNYPYPQETINQIRKQLNIKIP